MARALFADEYLIWARGVPLNSEQIRTGPLIAFLTLMFGVVLSVMTALVYVPFLRELAGLDVSAALLSTGLILAPRVIALPVVLLRSRVTLEKYRSVCATVELGIVAAMQAGAALAMRNALPAGSVFFSLWWILLAYSSGYTLRSTLSHPYQTLVTAIVALAVVIQSPSMVHLAIHLFAGVSATLLSLWGGYIGDKNDQLQADLTERTRQLEEALIQDARHRGFLTDGNDGRQTESLTIREGTGYRRLSLDGIVYLSAHGMKTTVHTDSGAFVASGTLGSLMSRLPAGRFLRLHKSYAVQASRLLRIQYFDDGRYMAFLNDEENTSLPVGRRYAPIVRMYMHLQVQPG